MEKTADITLIIVTYNSEHIINDTLDNAPNGYPIIIVDNASTDDTCGKIEAHPRPDVQLIRNDKNVGYGAGNNIGFKHCKTRYALILNPDAEITADNIERLKSALEQHETAVLAGPRILKSKQAPAKGKVKIKLYPLMHKKNPVLETKLKFWIRRSYKTSDFSKPHETAFVVGAVMLYDLQKMPKPIYFDEDIFMYGDEGEWQHRISNEGYKILIVPYATAYHIGEASSNFTDTRRKKIWSRYYQTGKTQGILVRKYPNKTSKVDIILFIAVNRFLQGVSYLLGMRSHAVKYSARLQGFKYGMQGTLTQRGEHDKAK